MSTFASMRITGEIRTGTAEAHECHGLGITLARIGSDRKSITVDVAANRGAQTSRHTFDMEEQREYVVPSEGGQITVVLQSISRVETRDKQKGIIYEFLFSTAE
jgi:hypothetical protein